MEESIDISGSVEAERLLLGCLLAMHASVDAMTDFLHAENFNSTQHRTIYEALCGLAGEGIPATLETLVVWLCKQGSLIDTGGRAYLEELAALPVGPVDPFLCAEAVWGKSMLRQLAAASKEIMDSALKGSADDAIVLLTHAEQKVFSLAEKGGRGRPGFTPVNHALAEAYEVLQTRYADFSEITGLATGFTEFDRMTGGLHSGELIVIGGRPSMGKTSLALNMAEYAAIKSKKPVAVFSMEMSASQLALRLISSLGRVNATRLRTGQLEDEDWSRVTSAIKMLRDAKIFIDDTPALSPDVLRSKARRLKREHGLGLIVVDCLQLMTLPGNSEDRATWISEITRSLKALAKELNVPVIALSQLNRSLETRTDKRPVMADLRESGAIEQDADVIVFIYRDDYYNRENSPDKGLAEVIIGKQRNGPTGAVKLKFFGEYTRFDNLSHDAVGVFE